MGMKGLYVIVLDLVEYGLDWFVFARVRLKHLDCLKFESRSYILVAQVRWLIDITPLSKYCPLKESVTYLN